MFLVPGEKDTASSFRKHRQKEKGFALGYFGKCASGTCPLTSNPIISTLMGALLSALLAKGK